MIAVLLFLTSKLTDWQEQEVVPGEKWPKAGLTAAPLGPRASGRERLGLGLLAAAVLLSIAEAASSKVPPSYLLPAWATSPSFTHVINSLVN